VADTKEVQAQLDLQLQINKVLQDRQAVLKAQEKALSDQVQLAVDMCKALKCEGLDDIEARLKTTREAMAAAAEEANRAGGALTEVGAKGAAAFGRASEATKSLSREMKVGKGIAAGFALGLIRGFGSALQTTKNLFSAVVGIIGGLGKLSVSIVTLPFRLLGGLFSLAQSGGGGGPSPTRQELENIRKEMGGLAQGAGAAAASALPQFRAQLSNLAGTGLSVRNVFGRGREGLAKAMAYNLELMKALGPAVDSFNGVIKKSAVELAMFRKGLGITAEQQAQLLKHAQAVGRDPVDAQREFASMAINMGEQFGMSASAIGKDMAEMKSDFASFGTLSVRELGQTAVFARKLGIEVKALQGLIGAFDDFETAAQNAAKLSQAFGMNIDAMKMMNAQNPAERLSILQKAFKESGKSVEQMTRQELKLLAAQSGLSEEAASLAFSQRGLSMSYDQVQKAGAKSEKKQLSQAEAMSKLADSIERVFGGGGGQQFTSFFDAFTKGFSRGIVKSKEFMEVSRAIRKSLREVYLGGIEIGKMFMRLFPGVKEMMKGLRDLFNPKRYRDLMNNFKCAFKDLFEDLRTDPKAGVQKFIERFKNIFKDFFQSGGDAANSVLEGGKTFLSALWEIAKAIAPVLLKGLVDAIKKTTEYLKNPPEIDGELKETFKNLFKDLFVATGDLLKELWTILWPPMKELFKTLWEVAGPWVKKAGMIALGFILVKIFSGAILGMAVSSLATMLGNVVLGIFGGPAVEGGVSKSLFGSIRVGVRAATKKLPALAGNIGSRISSILGPGISGGFARVASMISKFAGPVAIAVAIGTVGLSISKTTERLGKDLEQSFGKTAMQTGIMSASIIDAITLGLLPDEMIDTIAQFSAEIASALLDFAHQFLPKSVMKYIETQIDSMFNVLGGLGDILSGIMSFDPNMISQGIGKLFSGILLNLQNMLLNFPQMMLDLSLTVIEGLLSVVVEGALWLVTDGVKMLYSALVGLEKFITDKVVELGMSIFKFFTDPRYRADAISKAVKFGKDLIDGIVGRLASFKDRVVEIFSSAWTRFKAYWGIASPSRVMGTLGQNLLDGIIGTFGKFPAEILKKAQEAWNFMSETFSLGKLIEFGSGIVDDIMLGLSRISGRVKEVASKAWSSFSEFFSIDKLTGLGTSIVNGVETGLAGLKDTFVRGVSKAWRGVKDFFGWNSPATEGTGLGKSIVDGISNGLANLTPVMTGVSGTFMNSLRGVVSGTAQGVSSMSEVFSTGLDGASTVIGTVQSMSALFERVPQVVTSATESAMAMTRAYSDLGLALRAPLGDSSVQAVVDLGKALEGQKSLTVKHENVNINFAIEVKLDAASIGKGILKVNNTTDMGRETFTTTKTV
jgi:hypothetical protein